MLISACFFLLFLFSISGDGWLFLLKNNLLLLQFVFFIFLLSNYSLALGVVPSSNEITFSPDAKVVDKLKIINDGGASKQVVVYAEGELSKYISLPQSIISFNDGETEKLITYSVNIPSSFAVQGRHEGRIVLRELASSNSQISASLSVVSKVIIIVPYSGKYAEMRVFVGDFNVNKMSNFVIELNNLGTEDITSAQAHVKVISLYSGKEVASLFSDEARVPKKSKKLFTIHWTPNVPMGVYKVLASVVYDNHVVEDQKLLTIGSENIAIDSISVSDFKLGGIAKFDILLRNEWSSEINGVYAQVSVSKGSETFASSTTQTVSLPPLGSMVVNAYWDTNKVVPGSYDLKIKLFFGDSIVEKTFPIVVTQDKIDTGFTANVVSPQNSSSGSSNNSVIYLLVFLVIIILIINILLYLKFVRKR